MELHLTSALGFLELHECGCHGLCMHNIAPLSFRENANLKEPVVKISGSELELPGAPSFCQGSIKGDAPLLSVFLPGFVICCTDMSRAGNLGNSSIPSKAVMRRAAISSLMSCSIWLALVRAPWFFSYSSWRCLFRDQLCTAIFYKVGGRPWKVADIRGLANIRGERSAHLWTRGWTPRIQTYPGREVPNPLVIDVNKGEADINVVLKDILALTRLNYNTCIFGDRMPITLKFADAVGEILTAGHIKDVPPLPFGHYI